MPREQLMEGNAVFSRCRRYRYVLQRTWDANLPTVLFVALNPSTADEIQDDPTVRRCIGFARSWGFGRLVLANLFALRSTDPAALAVAQDPIGPRNNTWLRRLSSDAELTIAAWGVHGALRRRDQRVLAILRDVHTLGRTKAGHPRHPLYLPGSVRPVPLRCDFLS